MSYASWANHNFASYIPQKPIVLDDTVRRNVALGVPEDEIDDAQVLEALKKAHLKDHIESLEQGYKYRSR